MTMSEEEEPIDQNTKGGYGIDSDTQRSKNANFSLRSWARFLLQRHGK